MADGRAAYTQCAFWRQPDTGPRLVILVVKKRNDIGRATEGRLLFLMRMWMCMCVYERSHDAAEPPERPARQHHISMANRMLIMHSDPTSVASRHISQQKSISLVRQDQSMCRT